MANGSLNIWRIWLVFFILFQTSTGQCEWMDDIERTNKLARKLLAAIETAPYPRTVRQNIPKTTMTEIERVVLKTSRDTGVHKEFIKAIIKIESGFDIHARSHKGAMGLMQLMPETCKDYGVKYPFDPASNINGGTRFLKKLLLEFKDVKKALAAYNFGPGNVRRNIRWPHETREYVKKVITEFKKNT